MGKEYNLVEDAMRNEKRERVVSVVCPCTSGSLPLCVAVLVPVPDGVVVMFWEDEVNDEFSRESKETYPIPYTLTRVS